MIPRTAERRKPIWGITSVAAVPVGLLLIVGGTRLLIWLGQGGSENAGWGYVFFGMFVLPASMLLGLIAAVVAWARGEKCRVLLVVGILSAVSPVIYLALMALTHK